MDESGNARLIEPDGGNFEAMRARFRWDIPAHFNIAEAVCDRYRARSDCAIHAPEADGAYREISFARLHELANRLANALSALGVARGERVAIILPQRVETALAHIASYKLGAVALPLSVLFGRDALAYRLRDSGARVVITDAVRAPAVQTLQAELPALRHVVRCDGAGEGVPLQDLLGKASGAFHSVATLADDPALLIYTSGTTGPPKGALVAHRALLGNLTGFELSQNFFPQPGDVFWTPADWAWTGGLLDALLPSLYYGCPIVASPAGKFDPERACRVCETERVSNAFIPPTALKMMRQCGDLRGRFALRLRAVMSAGEQVGDELIHWGREALGVEINEMWGQTEFNYLVGNCAPVMPVRPGSMGKPYPGHRVEVIDAEGNPKRAGEPGELAAHADDPVRFLGYWRNDAATREKFLGQWFRTGDVAYRDEDGYLWFVGRGDDVISSAGYRIGPGEVEDSLLKHPAVAQAAVVGVPDAIRGEIVKAFVVLAEGHAPSEALAAAIGQSVRERLSAHAYPRAVEFIDELPMTTTGKVRRVALRERAAESSDRR